MSKKHIKHQTYVATFIYALSTLERLTELFENDG